MISLRGEDTATRRLRYDKHIRNLCTEVSIPEIHQGSFGIVRSGLWQEIYLNFPVPNLLKNRFHLWVYVLEDKRSHEQ